jgi:hypothetical protein
VVASLQRESVRCISLEIGLLKPGQDSAYLKIAME